jgi:hypothetical protein
MSGVASDNLELDFANLQGCNAKVRYATSDFHAQRAPHTTSIVLRVGSKHHSLVRMWPPNTTAGRCRWSFQAGKDSHNMCG